MGRNTNLGKWTCKKLKEDILLFCAENKILWRMKDYYFQLGFSFLDVLSILESKNSTLSSLKTFEYKQL